MQSAIKLELKVRGSPSVKGALIRFVRKRAKRCKQRKLQQVQCNGQSYVQYYARSL